MKKIFALVLAAVMLLSLAACGQKQETENGGNMKKFTVVVVHADGSEKKFDYETTEEFVGPVLQADNLIQGNAGPYGMEITHVDGEKAVYTEDGAYWAVYEGEEYAMQGIDTTPVVDGRTYKLVYERS